MGWEQDHVQPDQQRITGRVTQARQGAAHGRGAQLQALGGACHAALGKQHVERHQEEIEVRRWQWKTSST